MSVILVLAAFLTGGTLIFNAQRTSLSTDSNLSTQQAQFLAREAAFAGMDLEMTERIRLVVPAGMASPGWVSSFSISDASYNGAHYSVEGNIGACPNVAHWDSLAPYYGPGATTPAPTSWLMDVTSTGRYGSGAEAIYHEVNACYVIMNSETTTPPWTDYAFISDEDFVFNGGVSVDTISGLGNIHSNGDMDLGPNVRIAGNVTYTGDGDIHNKTETASFQEGEGISMETFNPFNETYKPDEDLGHRVDDTTPLLSGNVTVAPPGWVEGTPLVEGAVGTKSNPFYWYIDGNLTVDGTTHLRLPTHTIVVVTGNMSISGSASITVSAQKQPESGSGDALMQWINSNLDEGEGMLGFYVNGGYFLPPSGEFFDETTNGGITIGGTGNIVGNFFTNANYELNGGGQGSNMVGSVAAHGTITANGGGGGNNTARNFWYAGISDEIVHPGLLIPANLITRLSISEWKNDVIKNTGGPAL